MSLPTAAKLILRVGFCLFFSLETALYLIFRPALLEYPNINKELPEL